MALQAGKDISLLLIVSGGASDGALRLAALARKRGVAVRAESARELRRMNAGETVVEVLALEGPAPQQGLETLMTSEGIVFLLVGLRYPGNVGFILRSLEVAGGAGVVLDTDLGASQREEALRIGMYPDRFFPVIDAKAEDALRVARRAGRRIVAIETSGGVAPWETRLTGPLVVLVGSETDGIPDAHLAEADEVVAIPVNGFIPSYNVQAAVGIILGEWLRQNA